MAIQRSSGDGRAAARASGLDTGLGIPLHRGAEVAHVLVFLSAPETPLARAFEIWLPDASGRLRLDPCSYSRGLDGFARERRVTSYARGEGLPGRVLAGGRPIALDGFGARAAERQEAAVRAGFELCVGLPVHDGKRVRAVVLLLSGRRALRIPRVARAHRSSHIGPKRIR